ncbi:MAG: hypothetical protein SNJ84_02695 [Verrucomicrobiia bacterium]
MRKPKARKRSGASGRLHPEAKLMMTALLMGRSWQVSDQPLAHRRQAEIY